MTWAALKKAVKLMSGRYRYKDRIIQKLGGFELNGRGLKRWGSFWIVDRQYHVRYARLQEAMKAIDEETK